MRARRAAPASAQLCPSTRTVPAVASWRPSRISTVVVFPAPLGPSSPRHVPAGTEKDTPSTAVTSSKRFTRPSTEMASSGHGETFPYARGHCFAPPFA